jgi:hypothetical protein
VDNLLDQVKDLKIDNSPEIVEMVREINDIRLFLREDSKEILQHIKDRLKNVVSLTEQAFLRRIRAEVLLKEADLSSATIEQPVFVCWSSF